MMAGDYLDQVNGMPLVPLREIIGEEAVVIVSPHPDDETLGCGGLIAGARSLRRRVEIVVLTDGSGSHPRSKTHPPSRVTEIRRDETRRAVAVLGVAPESVTFLDVKDAAAPSSGPAFDDAVDAIEVVIGDAKAANLFVTWQHDPHCDHEAAAAMADALAARHPTLRVWHYPIWGLHLPPDATIPATSPKGVRLDITPWVGPKQAAIACYRSQMTRMIDDDPDGFCFTADTLAPFLMPYERFIEAAR